MDSLGVGSAPDAHLHGDEKANTFSNVSKTIGILDLPTFNKLGFGKITDIQAGQALAIASKYLERN